MKNQSSGYVDIQQLSKEVNNFKRNQSVNNDNIGFLKLNKRPKVHDTNTSRAMLDQSWFNNRQRLKDNVRTRVPASVRPPEDLELDRNDYLTNDLQKCIGQLNSSGYAIQKIEDVVLHGNEFIGIIKGIYKLSDSLNVVNISRCNIDRIETHHITQIGVVSIFKEWVSLNIDDMIVIRDYEEKDINEGTIQWTMDWKKVVSAESLT